MGLESVFELPVNFPIFLLASLFLSYLIWAKFLNRGSTKLGNKVDHILDILAITMVFFLTFPQVVLNEVPKAVLNNQISFQELIRGTQDIILILDLLLLFGFIVYFRNISGNRNKFNSMAIMILFIPTILFLNLLSETIVLPFTGYGGVYIFDLIFYTVLSGSLLLLSYILINNVFFKGRFYEQEFEFGKRKRKIKLYCVGLVLFSLFFIFFTITSYNSLPKIEYSSPEIDKYYIDYPLTESRIFAYTKTNIDISTFGLLKSSTDRIPIKVDIRGYSPLSYATYEYKEVRLIGKRKDNSTFTIVSDLNQLSDAPFYTNVLPFYMVQLDKEKDVAFMYFVNNESTKEVTSLIIAGAVSEPDGSKYSYDFDPNCERGKCSVSIFINNSLDKKLRQNDDTLINFDQRGLDYSTCKFIDLTYNSSVKGERQNIDCVDKNCDFRITEKKGTSWEELVSLSFRIGEGLLELRYVDMERPTNLVMTLNLTCNALA